MERNDADLTLSNSCFRYGRFTWISQFNFIFQGNLALHAPFRYSFSAPCKFTPRTAPPQSGNSFGDGAMVFLLLECPVLIILSIGLYLALVNRCAAIVNDKGLGSIFYTLAITALWFGGEIVGILM